MQFLNEKLLASPAFFGLFVDVDDKNSSHYILQVGSPVSWSTSR